MARRLACSMLADGGLPEDHSGAACSWVTHGASDEEVLAAFRAHVESNHRMAALAGRSIESLEAEAATVIQDE